MNAAGAIEWSGRRVLLKFHKFGAGDQGLAPNGLRALEHALGLAQVIEFDVSLLADGRYALLHDMRLDRETTGLGTVRSTEASALKRLRLRDSEEPPALLDEVVERLSRHDRELKIQIDLKEAEPLSPQEAGTLLGAIERLRENTLLRVVVGCLADWNLRLLKRLDPSLEVGNDPAFYLHAPSPGLHMPLPTRVNAYGYLDDHPLGFRRTIPVEAYLRDRLESLLAQVPGTSEFYLHKGFVAKAVADGFDPVAWLHSQAGMFVDIWTLNESHQSVADDLRLALEVGADQITTDTPGELLARAAALANPVKAHGEPGEAST